jgi:RNA polymerase sigma factor for flagellar operon FliA
VAEAGEIDVESHWKRYWETKRVDLRDELITNYLALVRRVVTQVSSRLPRHVRREDLYSTGVMGLIRAVERFDPSKGSQFESYAYLLIRGSIFDELRTLDWVPRGVHAKVHRVEGAIQQLRQRLGREPTEEETAQSLGMRLDAYRKLLERLHPVTLVPLDGDEETPISERIPDEGTKSAFEVADSREFRRIFQQAMRELPDQERTVMLLYYYENLMLKEISKLLGLSHGRISQIHTKALLRLRSRLGKARLSD